MSIEDLEEVSEKSCSLIDLLGGDLKVLKKLSPLMAHTQIVQLIYYLIPILENQSNEIANLRQKLAKKEDAIDIGDVIKEARLRDV